MQNFIQPSNRLFSGENKIEIRNNGMIAIRKAIPIKPEKNIIYAFKHSKKYKTIPMKIAGIISKLAHIWSCKNAENFFQAE